MTKYLLILGLLFGVRAGAQQSENTLRNFKRGTAITLFSGVGGGILGLSTLSFYGEPREHTSNITNGALLGILSGLSYVMWESSRSPQASSWSAIPLRDGALISYQIPMD